MDSVGLGTYLDRESRIKSTFQHHPMGDSLPDGTVLSLAGIRHVATLEYHRHPAASFRLAMPRRVGRHQSPVLLHPPVPDVEYRHFVSLGDFSERRTMA